MSSAATKRMCLCIYLYLRIHKCAHTHTHTSKHIKLTLSSRRAVVRGAGQSIPFSMARRSKNAFASEMFSHKVCQQQ